jgi:phosphonate transport system substrate-binding protein
MIPLTCAVAQDCPRGELDKAYCDRNGDLVADAPADPKQLVNPSTLIFAYTPVEDSAVYARVGEAMCKAAASPDITSLIRATGEPG